MAAEGEAQAVSVFVFVFVIVILEAVVAHEPMRSADGREAGGSGAQSGGMGGALELEWFVCGDRNRRDVELLVSESTGDLKAAVRLRLCRCLDTAKPV